MERKITLCSLMAVQCYKMSIDWHRFVRCTSSGKKYMKRLDIGRFVYHFCNIYTVQRDTQCSSTD